MKLEITYDQWENHLNQPENQKIKKEWNLLASTEERKKAIFNVLCSHKYENFAKATVKNGDTLENEERWRYEDQKFRWAILRVKQIKKVKWLTPKTITKMIDIINEIQTVDQILQETFWNTKPQSLWPEFGTFWWQQGKDRE